MIMDKVIEVLKAIRLSCESGFEMSDGTLRFMNGAILGNLDVGLLGPEFIKVIMSPDPSRGVRLMSEVGILKYILPELEQCRDMSDEGHKNIYEHSLSTLGRVSARTQSLSARLAALVHDVGKVEKKRMKYECRKCGVVRYRKFKKCECGGMFEEAGWCFHGHEDVGADVARRLGQELNLSAEVTEEASRLVALHMRPVSYTDEWTDRSIRRLVREAGSCIDNLLIIAENDADSASVKKIQACTRRIDRLRERIAELS